MPYTRRKIIAGAGAAGIAAAADAGIFLASGRDSEKKDRRCDVLVAGGGAAGFAAALSAADAGASVVILEKLTSLSNAHTDARNIAVAEPFAGNREFSDSLKRHYEDTMKAGLGSSDPKLVRIMVTEAPEVLRWLESLGMEFSETLINSGSHWPRSHVPIGSGYTQTFSKAAAKKNIRLLFGRKVTSLLKDRTGRITGVSAVLPDGSREEWFAGRGVVLAGGGFGRNPEIIRRFAPEKADFDSACGEGSTGELLIAAEKAGAALVDMDAVELVPRSSPANRIQAYMHINNARYIAVNAEGRRFIAEDALRSEIAEAYAKQPGQMAFEIGDTETVESYSMILQQDLWKGVEYGEVLKGDSIEELAAKMHVPAAALVKTVNDYNRAIRTKKDPLGKLPVNLSQTIDIPPYWAVLVKERIHLTPGGIRITEKAEVLGTDGSPVPHLYAAGEITGGVHGRNSLGGNSITDALVFGRIAGRSAAENR